MVYSNIPSLAYRETGAKAFRKVLTTVLFATEPDMKAAYVERRQEHERAQSATAALKAVCDEDRSMIRFSAATPWPTRLREYRELASATEYSRRCAAVR
jgi:hypothetical protein